jgi:hypothetical protein
VLDRLSAPSAPKPAPPAAAPGPVLHVDEAKLAGLAKAAEPVLTAPVAAPPPPADLAKANEKLSTLLGKAPAAKSDETGKK